MSQFRLCATNLVVAEDTITTVSSQDASFPKENIKHDFRQKVFRPGGLFVIDATNNKIDFDEGGGPLVATITVGSYTVSGLQTEIKTQLENAGAETYTVSKSTPTGTWTLASAGSTFDLLWNTGANTANSIGSTIGFDTANDDTGSLSYTSDNSAIHTQEWLVFNLGSALPIDTFAMVFDKLSGPVFSNAAVLKLQANATDAWSSPSLDVTLSIDSTYNTITHFFTADESYQYWRLSIVDANNAAGYVEVSKVLLGKATQLTQPPEIGFSHREDDLSSSTENRFGNVFADDYPIKRSLQVSYKALSLTDLRVLRSIFEDRKRIYPMWVSLDPTEVLFDKDEFLYYCTISNQYEPKHVFNIYFNVDMSFTEVM